MWTVLRYGSRQICTLAVEKKVSLDGEGVVYLWLELELHPRTRRSHDLLRVVPESAASRVRHLYDLHHD